MVEIPFRNYSFLPQTVEDGKPYLDEIGVGISDVRQVALSSLGARGTPTLILVNSDGIIIDSWVGMLSPEKEAEVWTRL